MQHMTKLLSSPPRPPRVSVPIDADTLRIFERLAKAGNMSTGKAIAEWLFDTVEGAELMASTMERARAAPKIVTAELHAMMLGMADQTKELQDKFRKYKGSMDDGPDGAGSGGGVGEPQAARAASGAGSGGAKVKSPPPCNTGGKVPEGKNPKRGGKSS